MGKLPRLGLEYPSLNQRPWFDIFERLIQGIDAAIYSHREDRNMIMEGGGTISWAAPSLSWTETIYLVSPYTGYAMQIPVGQSPIDIGDGQTLYVVLSRSLTGNTIVTAQVTSVLPSSNNAYMLAVRRGDTLYFRNGAGFADGQSGPIYGHPGRLEYAYFPITDAADGSVPPATVSVLADPSGGSVNIRKFDGAASAEDVSFTCLNMPAGTVTASGIRARVTSFVSEATGPSNEGVRFVLACWAIGDGDSLSQTPDLGAVSKTGMTLSQYDTFVTDWVGMNPPGLAAGKMLVLLVARDPTHVDDTYAQDIGVAGAEVEYTRS